MQEMITLFQIWACCSKSGTSSFLSLPLFIPKGNVSFSLSCSPLSNEREQWNLPFADSSSRAKNAVLQIVRIYKISRQFLLEKNYRGLIIWISLLHGCLHGPARYHLKEETMTKRMNLIACEMHHYKESYCVVPDLEQ